VLEQYNKERKKERKKERRRGREKTKGNETRELTLVIMYLGRAEKRQNLKNHYPFKSLVLFRRIQKQGSLLEAELEAVFLGFESGNVQKLFQVNHPQGLKLPVFFAPEVGQKGIFQNKVPLFPILQNQEKVYQTRV